MESGSPARDACTVPQTAALRDVPLAHTLITGKNWF